MRKIFKIFLVVLLVLIGGATAFIYEFQSSSKFNGSYNILLICVDPTENNGTEGMGACDMAYAINITGGKLVNMTPVYPGGKRSQIYTEPSELGSGMLLLHDSLYGVNTTEGAARAQEIVEYNTGITTDAVVMINPNAVDALLAAMGTIEVDDNTVTISDSIEYIRNMTEKENSTATRGESVESIMGPIINATQNNPFTYANLAKVALEQCNEGNIRVMPESLITEFAISTGLKSLWGS